MSGFPNSIISVCVSIGFLYLSVLYCNCQTTTLTPVDPDVVEGSDITFACAVSSTEHYVNWQLVVNATTSYITQMSVQNEECALGSSKSFLLNTTKYSFTCTSTVYQVTVKNVQRSQHNSVWSCYPPGQTSRPTSTINVHVPPTIGECTFYYNNKPNNVITITETLMIIEHESFTLECSSAGKPAPNTSWTLPSSPTATTKSVTINEVTRDTRGNYVFYASSTLRPSYQAARDITVNKSITVEILFPPMVTNMNNISQLVGTRLEFDCPYMLGFPTETTFKWSRNVDSHTWNTRKLLIPNVRKEDAGNYQCNVSNIMQPSGDSQSYTGSDAKLFYLNVFYKASIPSFTIDGFTENVVTVNESYQTSFMCNVDSNPSAFITLKNHNGIVKTVTSEKLEHTIEATCSDAGTYTCSARNEHNGEDVPIRTIQLFVNCLPRSAENVNQNRASEKGQTYTITFNAIAYPVPTFDWWKFVEGTWTKLESDDRHDRHVIESSDLQTNLTINKLILQDFTSYKLVTGNTIGEIEQTYMLEQYDVPNHPTDLQHDEALTTTSTVVITWKPGNNGGLPQTFHIRYKKGSSSTWNYIDVTDNGDKIMNYSINGLAEKTHYDIVIYASNEKGNSTESNVFKTFTKENEGSETSNIGSVVGYSVGAFFILVLLITLLVWRFRLKRAKSGNQGAYQSDANETNAIPTIAELYRNEESASNYETLAMQNRDVSNYSALADLASDQLHDSVVYDNVTME